jgi:hypothetical protein
MRRGLNRIRLTVSGLSNLEAVKLEIANGYPALGGAGRVDGAEGVNVKRFVRSSPFRGRYKVSAITIPATAVNSEDKFEITLHISLQHLQSGESTSRVGITGSTFYGTAIEARISAALTNESIRKTVLSAIKSWQADNGIQVRTEAVADIATQFGTGENQVLIRDLHDQFRLQMPDQITFLDVLVRGYLYSLRDLSLEASRMPISVVQLQEPFQTEVGIGAITSTQVRKIAVHDFLRAWFGLNLKHATLEITSRPDHARPISIDDNPPKGASTNAECSLPSPSTHTITVMGDPEWTVRVVVNCPGPHGTISCREPGHPCEARLTERCEEWVYTVLRYGSDR